MVKFGKARPQITANLSSEDKLDKCQMKWDINWRKKLMEIRGTLREVLGVTRTQTCPVSKSSKMYPGDLVILHSNCERGRMVGETKLHIKCS